MKGDIFHEETIKRIQTQIKEDINKALEKFVGENGFNFQYFPIEFENEFGKFKVNEDGTTYYQPIKGFEYIDININIKL